MSGEHDDGLVSPLSAATGQPYHSLHRDPEANAPEVVGISASPYHHAQSPSVAGSSPGTFYSRTYSPTVTGHHDSDQGKEVLQYEGIDKIPLHPTEYADYPQVASDLYAKDAAGNAGAAAEVARSKKILGMRRTVFFIVLAVLCIAIAVAVGAGVGATLPSKSKSATAASTGDHAGGSSSSSSPGSPSGSSTGALSTSSASSSPDASPSTSPTKSSDSKTSGSSTTSSATPTPTFLNQTTLTNNQGWGFQGYSEQGFAGDYTTVFLNDGDFVDTEKGIDFKIAINSYQWLQRGTNCCVSFCNNSTHAGWIGYQCQAKKQPKTTQTFTRIWVWCSDDHNQPNAERCGAS
ncbi:hypothetical protein NLG97_g928 [Lecanicillium saksenae]|uniref:Uncharacterized protein n=1 Tax=Lecanicillium saksenae TaxID=468837 RepID=A0ACC1R9A3_9HYPO|nr:hypothetical protein NLG97_g928 [Lecanicillium saksenae]